MREFEGMFDQIKRHQPDFSYEISDPTLFVSPLQTSQDSLLITAIENATSMILRKESIIKTFPGSTDAPNFNCPAVIFGAGNLKQCHSLSEYINVEDLIQAVKIYVETIRSLQRP